MSIKLMSAIFETEFPEKLTGEDGETNIRGSTAKLVLLAIADHANNEGESAYPGLSRLHIKTGLTKRGIINAIEVLKFNGLVNVAALPSKRGTNNYTIVTGAYPVLSGGENSLVVNPVPQVVNPVPESGEPSSPESSLNRQLTTRENVNSNDKTPTDWLIAGGVSSEEIARLNAKEQAEKKVSDHYERKMGYNPLPWHSNKDLEALLRFLLDKSAEEITTFAEWSRKDFSPLSPAKARQYPRMVIECWPQAFADEPYRDPRMKEWHDDD